MSGDASDGTVRQDSDHPSIWWVKSQSDPGVERRVEVVEEYTTCSCPHGLNNPGEARCWHVDAVLHRVGYYSMQEDVPHEGQ